MKRLKLLWLILALAASGVTGLAVAGFWRDEPADEQKGAAISSAQAGPTQAASTAAGMFEHRALDRLLAAHVDEAGRVNYGALALERAALDAYLATLAKAAPDSFRNDDERLAFWINAYNAYTLRDVLDDVYGKAKGVKAVPGFFDKKRHAVAGHELTLDEIEGRARKFRDPRIHFAVNCASTSCPKLQRFAFTGAQLQAQLDRATQEFLADPERGLRLDKERNRIYLSSLFKWYAGDFTGSSNKVGRALAIAKAFVSGDDVRDYVRERAAPDIGQYIRERKPDVKYLDYDWSLNAQEAQQATTPKGER